MKYRLFDTNVISFFVKRHPHRLKYRKYYHGHMGAASFQTVAELRIGARLAQWGPVKCREMENQLAAYTIFQSDEDVVWHFIEVSYARRYQPISTADAWIAATALAFDLELVTHNASDFHGIPGLHVLTENP